ncbi:MAG: phosphoglycolate phosphatase [Gammaproteobacteria bacterium]|uniref:Phosphoglycolate phosphatase n=1 Tax=Candidatus Thiopontia autotrophica TaxID=2841688 RepID=A0A8J6TSM2_9GAMM|nr:phosphoglycolate phosphatase [Candidatus Thiopontia autotrophica]MBL6969232.1 phosphoglycolate phosphatase [Gammaproteobacteria bacterium]
MVLIDVDGTLVDSVPDLAWCVDEMMSKIGMPTRGESRVREWVGNGVERLVGRALTNSLDGKPEGELFEQALPIFSELYAENTSKRSQLYPGVEEGLEWLKSQPVRLGCVTNKAARYTNPLLNDLGIADAFEIVVSGDTLSVKKPDPGPLLHVSNFFGLAPNEALMVGDSVSDVKAARAAGFEIVCMSYGYNHGEDIRTSNPDAVIDSMAELPSLFQ